MVGLQTAECCCRTLNWHQQKITYTRVLASLHRLPENFSLNFLGPSWSQPPSLSLTYSNIRSSGTRLLLLAHTGHTYSVQNSWGSGFQGENLEFTPTDSTDSFKNQLKPFLNKQVFNSFVVLCFILLLYIVVCFICISYFIHFTYWLT